MNFYGQRTWRIRLLWIALIASTCGCTSSKDLSMSEIKINDAPQNKYAVIFSLNNPPGAFASAKGFATYDIGNKTCLPPADNFQGVQMAKSALVLPLTLSKSGDGQFSTIVALDGVSDSDLYGHGICHWSLTSTHIRLSATDKEGDTNFVAALSGSELGDAEPSTLYYLKSEYPSVNGLGLPNHGIKDLSLRNPVVPEDGWFTISISSKELTQ